jgi:hypothetical protein
MPGARCARRRMCEWVIEGSTRVSQVTPNRPAFPTQCFTAYDVLASAVAFSTVAGRSLHRLEASIGCIGTTRFCRPSRAPPSGAPSTATATRPALLTLRNAPRSGTGWDGYNGDLGIRKIGIFLREGLDGRFTDLPVVGQISWRSWRSSSGRAILGGNKLGCSRLSPLLNM